MHNGLVRGLNSLSKGAHFDVSIDNPPSMDLNFTGLNASLDPAGTVNRDLISGNDIALEGSTHLDLADLDISFDDGAVANDQMILGIDFALENTINSNDTFERKLTVEFTTFIEKRDC